MAKFKLYLLNLHPSSGNSSTMATRIPISEFEIISNQYEDNLIEYWKLAENVTNTEKKHLKNRQTTNLSHNPHFCYTSNEKFQLHQNTQRTLTFSMVRDIVREDRIEKNPFINYLYVGAQLLLEDKYDNHHLMTVSKINYEFHKLNTVFNYECQDSFNYQLSRQNAGYEIINNVEDVDFVGAKPLDWWVLCKIQPECNISYQYIQLNHTLNKIKTISYSKEQYPEFHKTIPFAASGTANSVLISLGEQYGLQLHVYERFNASGNNGTIDKYYWFEPTKSLRPSGLTYSPDFNLQNFGLEHVGTSFTSVLNVQAVTVGEDLITMIPTVPAFFRTWFETEEWANSQFTSGLFLSTCQEHLVNWNIEEFNIDQHITNDNSFIDNNYLYIRILATVKWDEKYDQIKFSTNGGLHSIVHVSGFDSENNPMAITYNSKYQPWSFGTYNNLTDNLDLKFQSFNTPKECEGFVIWIRLELPSTIKDVAAIGTIYLSQYREPTTEELEFAIIADQIPWLENRLVDFKYFYDHSIINLQQYHDIMNIFENDLRKANAKLLLYSQLYYQSLKTKTKIIADLSTQLDIVGATFQADLIKPFQTDGRVKQTTEFQLALSDLFSNKDTAVELIDYYITLADYLNKYVTAEQNFLKNMYLFRQYFYEPCGFGNLYQYTWTLEDIKNSITIHNKNYRYAFTNRLSDYIKLTSKNYQQDIFIQTQINNEKKYIPFDKNEVVENYHNNKYYYLNPQSDGYVLIDANNQLSYNGWNDGAIYYELQWEIDISNMMLSTFENIRKLMQTTAEDKTTYYQTIAVVENPDKRKFQLESLKTNELNEPTKIRISCYQHCLHTVALKEDESNKDDNNHDGNISLTTNIKNINLSHHRVYKKTTLGEMRKNYFYRTLTKKDTTLYQHRFIHRHLNDFNSLLQLASLFWKSNFSDLNISKKLLTFLPNAKNWTQNRIQNDGEINTIYAESFPMTSWYYQETLEDKSVKYHNIPFVNIENCSTFMRRISVSAKARSNWLLWGGIGGVVIGSAVGGLVGGLLGAGLVHGICAAAWKNGDYGFGNDGWTYQDVYGNALDEGFQNYYSGAEIVYVTSEEGYQNATKDVENPSTTSLTWNPTVAANLLFTYLSYMAPINDEDDNTKQQENYYYQTSFWRILTPEDLITKTDSIGIISLKNTDWIKNIIVNNEQLSTGPDETSVINYKRIDNIIYYPLIGQIINISGSDFDWSGIDSNQKTVALKDLGWEKAHAINDLKWDQDTTHYWLKDKNNSNEYAIFLKAENFIYEDFSKEEFKYDKIEALASAKYYLNDTLQPFDIIEMCPDITQGYYVTGLEDNDYIPTSDLFNENNQLPENIDNYEFYEKMEGNWVRRYNKNQLIARNDTYVRTDNAYQYNSFTSVDEINIQCYRYVQDQEEWIFDQIRQGKIILNTNNNQWELTFNEDEQLELQTHIDLKLLSNYTNAEYWYQYRNSSSTVLAEKAMLIETNLTEYWTNAYYASKNCKYFLPEFWQPTINQTKNYYSTNIISPKYQQNGSVYELQSMDLSTTYVPIITKITNQNKFQFRHISQVYGDQTIAMEQKYNLPLNNHVPLYDIIQESIPIKDIMDYLNISPNAADWVGVNIKNRYVLYEYVSGGRLWNEELQSLSGNALHYPDKFGGWYDMMIKVLISCNYKNYSPVLYKQAQEEHNRIWAQLYSQYPHLILEQSYKNETATASAELLQMAQYAFKDYSQIESNYSISVIDPWILKGYKGQELQVGDGIEINAAELYDNHDSDIYRSLIQYLYITDISYDLRRDDNIQLTVNTIKYQDKVIGQLIKLIR